MSNPLYQLLNGGRQNNIFGMIDRFNQFRQNLQGDPRQIVQQLLNSGQMSQQDFNRYSQMAQEFQKFLR